MDKKDYKNVIILLSISLITIFIIFLTGNIFGSNMDFINQHTVIPEYFREYFYNNHKLIPNIFYNLGLGQNAFNFSYYGLLNPIVLISYLLPFISMRNYIMISSMIILLITQFLFYKWIRNHFDSKYSFLLTLLFTMTSPISFHFHRQIMFVNYLPFLLLNLINVDNYSKMSSKIFLVINIFLMIMTSYYFSVGGILAIIIYYLYKNIGSSFKEKIKILVPIFLGIMLSAVLLLPTLASILSNRMDTDSTINLLSLFIPDFSYDNVLYSSYALGLFGIGIISLIWLLIKNNKLEKFLSLILLILITFPILRYLLNGGLYVRSKVLIPFIPLFILVIGIFLKDLLTNKVDFRKLFIGIGISLFLSLFNFNIGYLLDILGTTLLLFLYYKFKNKKIILIPIVILFTGSYIYTNINEDYISTYEYEKLNNDNKFIDKLVTDSTFYRSSNLNQTLYNVNYGNNFKASIYSSTINNNYSNFYHNIMKINNNNYNNLIIRDTENIIFNKLMGIKYIYSNFKLGYGYEEVSDSIYENTYSNSLGYASTNIYSEKQFNDLGYPYNLKYLLNGIVVSGDSNLDTENIIEELTIDLNIEFGDFIDVQKDNSETKLIVREDSSFAVDLKNTLANKLLFITLSGLKSNSCKNNDIEIEINNIKNSLSCETWLYNNHNHNFNYLINQNNLRYLDVKIKKGIYNISDIKFYTMDTKYLNSSFDEMKNILVKDNKINGDILVTSNSYMILSLPYDNNYQIIVDGKNIDYEKANLSFIGFKINEGNHHIEIIYEAKYLKESKLISGLGLILFLVYIGIIKLVQCQVVLVDPKTNDK